MNMHCVGDCNPTNDSRQYTGHTSVTESGKQCQAWASQSPHSHSYTQDSMFPDGSVTDASNYCRNPSNYDEGLWCYTTDPLTRWEKCNVPLCGQLLFFTKWTFCRNCISFSWSNIPTGITPISAFNGIVTVWFRFSKWTYDIMLLLAKFWLERHTVFIAQNNHTILFDLSYTIAVSDR